MIGYRWAVRCIDGFYQPNEIPKTNLEDVYKEIQEYNYPLEVVYIEEVTKNPSLEYEWDFKKIIKKATKIFYKKY